MTQTRLDPTARVAKRLALLSLVAPMLCATNTLADTANTLSNYVGYTIVAEKTIAGWASEDDKQMGDSFEGCEAGRKILFEDNTYLVCSGYSYKYAYRPHAIILSNGYSFVMVIDDDSFDMRKQ